MANIFNQLELDAFKAGITPRTRQSRDWFRGKAQNLRVNRNELMKQEPIKLSSREVVGSMYMFFYDPKLKESLPYYDSFPLVIVIGPASGGFLGMNLHYIAPALRAKLLDSLMDVTTDEKYNDKTRFEVSYRMLKSAAKYKWFKPCVKHYLSSNVKSRFARVPAPEWEIAAFLPTADFQKASKSTVYADSKRMI